jgi:hypothetical protein
MWGSLLVEEKYREEKACDRRHNNNNNNNNNKFSFINVPVQQHCGQLQG